LSKQKTLFRVTPKDLTLIAVIPFQITVLVSLAMWYQELPWWSFFWLLPLHFALSLQGTSANHNHYHTPIFYNKRLNGLLRLGYSSVTSPKTPHNAGHGIHHIAKESFNQSSVLGVMGLNKALWKQIVGLFRYVFYFFGGQYIVYLILLRIWPIERLVKFAMPNEPEMGERFFRTLTKRDVLIAAQNDVIIWLAFKGLLLVIDWQFFFFYFLPANFLIDTFRQNENYVQHWGATDPNDNKRDAVSCYGKLYNMLTFNLGYHQEHHFKPGTHWLDLPKITEQLPHDRRVVPFMHYVNLPIFYPKLSLALQSN